MRIRTLSGISSKWQEFLAAAALTCLTACGGGGGGSAGAAGGGVVVVTCSINCDPINTTNYYGAYVEASGGGGDGGGSSGAGGAAGDGAAIADRPITLTDAKGVTLTSTTDAKGKFSFVVTGMTAPLVVKVTKADGTVRMSFTRVQPTVGKTISISVTGLSDKIASDVVGSLKTTVVGSQNLTPAMVTQAAGAIPALLTTLNTAIAKTLTDNGIDPAKFDPMAAVLVPAAAGSTANAYDKVLDSLAITPGTTGTSTVILTPLQAAKNLFKNLRDMSGAYSSTGNTGELDVADKKLRDAAKAAISPIDTDTLRILGGFFKAESMYSQYKSGASSVYAMGYGSTQYGQINTKDIFGGAVGPTTLSSYGCEVKKIGLLANGAIDLTNTRIVGSYIIGGTQASPTITPALATAQANGFNCYGIATQGRLIGSLLDDGMTRINAINFIPQANGSYNYISHTIKAPADRTGLFNTATGLHATSVSDGTAKFGTLTPVRDGSGNITSFTVTGDMRTGFAKMPDRTVATWQSYAGYNVTLTATETSTTTTKTQTFSGSIALNKTDGTVAATATIGAGSTLTETMNVVTGTSTSGYSRFTGNVPCLTGETQSGVAPYISCFGSSTANVTNQVISSGTLNVAITAPGIKFEGVLGMANPAEDKTGTLDTSLVKYYRPTSVTFTGKLYDTDAANAYRLFFDGTLSATTPNWSSFDSTLPESSTNFLQKTMGFDGKLYLVNRPVVNLSMNLAQTGYKTGTTTGSFKWSDANGFPNGFTMTGVYDNAANTGSITFRSTDVNATFTLPKNTKATPQKIYVNNLEQGSITLSTKRIDYKDGTFEQF